MVEVRGANSSSIDRGEATTQRAVTLWPTQAIASSSAMNMSKALLLRCLSGRNQIGKHLTVDVSNYHGMTKLRPSLKGAHTPKDKLFLGTLGKVLLGLLRFIPLELDILSRQTCKATKSRATTRVWRSVPGYTDVLRHASSLVALPVHEPQSSYSSLSAIQTLLVKSSARNAIEWALSFCYRARRVAA